MARSKDNFKEFELKKGGNLASGRVYSGTKNDKTGSVMYPLSLTINGLVIKGCKLVDSEKSTFISMPQYQTKDGKYENICFFVEREDIDFMKELAQKVLSLVD